MFFIHNQQEKKVFIVIEIIDTEDARKIGIVHNGDCFRNKPSLVGGEPHCDPTHLGP